MNRSICYQPDFAVFLDPENKCFCKKILDFSHIGFLLALPDGTVKYMNPTFAQMFQIDLSKAINTNICEYFPNSRLLSVMQTGQADEGAKFSFKGQDALVSRYPVIRDGQVVAGLIEVFFRDLTELNQLMNKMNSLEQKVRYYKKKVQGLPGAQYTFNEIIGASKVIQALKRNGLKFAQSSQPVLIEGESGSGKELVAHSLHAASPRANEIFVRINCAAIPNDLLEAELFGYEEGTFTGAAAGGKVGKFELADGGTVFLDEIGDLPMAMQAKLLRVLDNKEIQKIGKSMPIYSDFRVVTATNKDLSRCVEHGAFREDLYHRLSVITLRVPPLRERTEDLPMLAAHYLNTLEDRPRGVTLRISPTVLDLFRAYSWPGNIRELKNVLSFALLSIEEGQIEVCLRHLPRYIIEKRVMESAPPAAPMASSLTESREKAEKDAILAALEQSTQNKSQAAKILGISRNELYKKIRKYRLLSHGLTC